MNQLTKFRINESYRIKCLCIYSILYQYCDSSNCSLYICIFESGNVKVIVVCSIYLEHDLFNAKINSTIFKLDNLPTLRII